RKGPVKIVLSSAGIVHELEVARGAIRRASRTSPDGRLEGGARAAATALGTREGTYVVEDARSVAPGDQDLTVAALDLIRAATRGLATARAERIVELRFDPDAEHLTKTLEPSRVAARLVGGASPRALVENGEAAPEDVMALARDLSLRGV